MEPIERCELWTWCKNTNEKENEKKWQECWGTERVLVNGFQQILEIVPTYKLWKVSCRSVKGSKFWAGSKNLHAVIGMPSRNVHDHISIKKVQPFGVRMTIKLPDRRRQIPSVERTALRILSFQASYLKMKGSGDCMNKSDMWLFLYWRWFPLFSRPSAFRRIE